MCNHFGCQHNCQCNGNVRQGVNPISNDNALFGRRCCNNNPIIIRGPVGPTGATGATGATATLIFAQFTLCFTYSFLYV